MSESFPIDCLTFFNDCLTPPIDIVFEFSNDEDGCTLFLILSPTDFLILIDCWMEFPKFLDNFSNGSLFYITEFDCLFIWLEDYLSVWFSEVLYVFYGFNSIFCTELFIVLLFYLEAISLR